MTTEPALPDVWIGPKRTEFSLLIRVPSVYELHRSLSWDGSPIIIIWNSLSTDACRGGCSAGSPAPSFPTGNSEELGSGEKARVAQAPPRMRGTDGRKIMIASRR